MYDEELDDDELNELIRRRIEECLCASGTQECPSHPYNGGY